MEEQRKNDKTPPGAGAGVWCFRLIPVVRSVEQVVGRNVENRS